MNLLAERMAKGHGLLNRVTLNPLYRTVTTKMKIRYPKPKLVTVKAEKVLKPPIPLEEMEDWELEAWMKAMEEKRRLITMVGTVPVKAQENTLTILAEIRPSREIARVKTGGLYEIVEVLPVRTSITAKLEYGDRELGRKVTRAIREYFKEKVGKLPICLPSERRIDCWTDVALSRGALPDFLDKLSEDLCDMLEKAEIKCVREK